MAEPNDFAKFLSTLEARLEQLEAQFGAVISPPNPAPNLQTYAAYIIELEKRVEALEQDDG